MSKRKDMLSAMLAGRSEPAELPADNKPETDAEAPAPVRSPVPARASSVSAMGRSIEHIAQAANEARAMIAAGENVVEIDVAKIEPSFVQDRLDGDDESFFELVASIRQRGQQVPVLLRPHPTTQGRFQVAYGHRRVRAARELGRPIRAVVRSLSDEELIIAQGQENSARVDLSYMERARFAAALEALGYDREIIGSALNADKTHVSRYLSLAHAVPDSVVKAIGPAPRAGRPRWTALAERLSSLKDLGKVESLLMEPAFRAADSDTRFVRVFAALAPKRPERRSKSVAWRGDDGRKVATVERGAGQITIIVRDKDAPNFGEFVAAKLDDLYRSFRKLNEEGPGSN